MIMQIAAPNKWKATIGDLWEAFMQSDKLVRENGKLYAEQPRSGLPGMEPRQLIELVSGVYGLGDAPLRFRKGLKRDLLDLGYR
jgi:hypothetical protein